MREITATDHIEREICGTLLPILHLDFYVWSFYAFLLDNSTYTNSLWCLRLSSQAFAPPQLGASATALFPSWHALERSSPVVFIKSTRDFYCTQFFTVSALSFIWEHFFSLHLLSHCSTLLDHRYSCTIYVPSCNFYSSDFSIFLAYVWQQLILSQHLSKSK